MDFTEYVKPELLILIPFLFGLGMILKASEQIRDNHIPLILSSVSLLLSALYVIGTEGVSALSIFTAIVQSVLVAAAAVFTHQLIKQANKVD